MQKLKPDRSLICLMRRHKLHEGKPVRYTEVHKNTWRRIAILVVKGYVDVKKEYGIATARITAKGKLACRGLKPGPRPGTGKKGETAFNCMYAVDETAHWSVKLVTQLMGERGVSQRQLGIRSGIAPATINHWFDGKSPGVDKVEAVLAVFDLNLGTAWIEWERRNAEAQRKAEAESQAA